MTRNDALHDPVHRVGLLVDDDEIYLATLQRALLRHNITTLTAIDSAAALEHARNIAPDFALVDLNLGNESGLALIPALRALRSDMRILLITGYASVATAVDAIKLGADDYLPKPTTVARILRALGVTTSGGEIASSEPTMTPLHRLEWEHIQQAMRDCNGNVSAAARLLGMHRRSLQRKLFKRPAAIAPNID